MARKATLGMAIAVCRPKQSALLLPPCIVALVAWRLLVERGVKMDARYVGFIMAVDFMSVCCWARGAQGGVAAVCV